MAGRGRPRKHKVQEVIEALDNTQGNISKLARKLGVDWRTAKSYIEGSTKVKEAWEAEKEAAIDYAEEKLQQHIVHGDLRAIRFFLGTIGKDRGYFGKQQQQVTGNPDEPVEIIVRYEDQSKG